MRFTIFYLVVFLAVYVQSQEIDQSVRPEDTTELQEQSESNATEKETLEAEEPSDTVSSSDVEQFYRDFGFGLFPKTRNFSIRNIWKNSLSYDSNVFLSQSDVEDDFVYTSDFMTILEYTPGKLYLEMLGGVSYQDYFENNSADQTLPRARINLKYDDKVWRFMLEGTIARNSTVNTSEVSGRTPWHSGLLNMTLGMQYERWSFEINTSYNYTDFRNIRGDHYIYGQSYVVGYDVTPRIAFNLAYMWNQTDYREAYFIASKNRYQEDALSHIVNVGLEWKFTKKLKGNLKAGIEFRQNDILPFAKANVMWDISRRFQVNWSTFLGTVPSFLEDYQERFNSNLSCKYLLTRRLILDIGINFEYNRPKLWYDSTRFTMQSNVTYRLYRGIDLQILYNGDFQETQNSIRNYQMHKITTAVSIIF